MEQGTRLPAKLAHLYQVVEMGQEGDVLLLGAVPPQDPSLADELSGLLGRPVRLVDISRQALQEKLASYSEAEDNSVQAVLKNLTRRARGDQGRNNWSLRNPRASWTMRL